ncbi:MAG: phosphopantothenoylcysteine decarboxylase, partial [Gammaproteobacteria bacterium]
AVDAGAQVTLIAGPVSLASPPRVERVDVESAMEMYDTAMDRIGDFDIYIGAAAISDYRPESVVNQKIKKSSDTFTLSMVKSPDLLASIAAMQDGPFTVGFAAETEKLEEHAHTKLAGKRLDMIVANLVGSGLGFDRDDNTALVLWGDGQQPIPNMAKTEMARQLITLIASRYRSIGDNPHPHLRPVAN